MKNFFITRYKVKGIKNIKEDVELSFYKKILSSNIDTSNYNVKGIYGINGSGKSGIITSIDILKNLIMDNSYLNDRMIQKKLEAVINKDLGMLLIEVDFLVKIDKDKLIYRYNIDLVKDVVGNFVIDKEELSYRNLKSISKDFIELIKVYKGTDIQISSENNSIWGESFKNKVINLLSTSSVSSLLVHKIFLKEGIKDNNINFVFKSLYYLFLFGLNLNIYMDISDEHTEYILNDILDVNNNYERYILSDEGDTVLERVFKPRLNTYVNTIFEINLVPKNGIDEFEKSIKKLENFIKVFKSSLKCIKIEKKEHETYYECRLKMSYNSYLVDAEFESTGIKKLIKLYSYIQKMLKGQIVFIDEFDSNLHDVYLCALLEFIMEYGNGQLCFTTHNLGPMDILKRNKKSIDLLSTNQKIYSWKTNGNYSPSSLYRKGMIEGSPFNIEMIDFINVFDLEEENL